MDCPLGQNKLAVVERWSLLKVRLYNCMSDLLDWSSWSVSKICNTRICWLMIPRSKKWGSSWVLIYSKKWKEQAIDEVVRYENHSVKYGKKVLPWCIWQMSAELEPEFWAKRRLFPGNKWRNIQRSTTKWMATVNQWADKATWNPWEKVRRGASKEPPLQENKWKTASMTDLRFLP